MIRVKFAGDAVERMQWLGAVLLGWAVLGLGLHGLVIVGWSVYQIVRLGDMYGYLINAMTWAGYTQWGIALLQMLGLVLGPVLLVRVRRVRGRELDAKKLRGALVRAGVLLLLALLLQTAMTVIIQIVINW